MIVHNYHLKQGLKHLVGDVAASVASIPEQLRFLIVPRPSPAQSIILAGSGRSGTTWIADLLTSYSNIQQIFEPLNPVWVTQASKVTGWGRDRRIVRSKYLRSSDQHGDWEEFLQQMLTGRVRSWGWTDHKRTSYFPDRYLIKEIRMNLMLGYVYDRFQPTIIYLVRHPCAVIHSQLKSGWHASIADILSQEELVEDHLRPFLDQIEQVRESRLGTLALWWALENSIALKELSLRPHVFIRYEGLLEQSFHDLSILFDGTGAVIDEKAFQNAKRPSRTARNVGGNYFYRPSAKWQRDLSDEDKKVIMRWVEMFGLNHLLESD